MILVTADVSFKNIKIKLEEKDTRERILKYSPSGKVPVLLQDDLVINDSLAISEYIAERHPDVHLWPQSQQLRALARAAAAEMHSGFPNVRTQMPFGVNTGDVPDVLTAETKEEIQRIFDIWSHLRTVSGATQFLCGDFGIVDAMFAPVVFRFRRYGIVVPASLQAYVDAMLAYPPVQQWLQLAAEEMD